MLLCDTHADTLYAMQLADRNPAQPLDITREALTASQADTRVQAMALFTGPKGLAAEPHLIDRQLAMLHQLLQNGFRQITCLAEAQPGQANLLLTVEGGEVFHGGVEKVDAFYALGVRAAALVWNNENQLAAPAVGGHSRGLTPYGRQVALRMHALGMAVDLSHISPQGVQDVLALGGPPPMASHSCAHALCPHPRNLTNGQLRSIFQAGGYVGVNFYPLFLSESGQATLDTVIDHMAHMLALGGEGHVGMGSDFDGIDSHPAGLRNAAAVPALLERLAQRGFSARAIRLLAGESFARYMARVEAGKGNE